MGKFTKQKLAPKRTGPQQGGYEQNRQAHNREVTILKLARQEKKEKTKPGTKQGG
jgi:hypothetical protein